jgi:hypothetical protein
VLDTNPHIWQRAADLNKMVSAELIQQASDGSPFVTEALTRKIAAMKRELAGPRPTPLMTLAVDRVVTCWLQLEILELATPDPKADRTPRESWWLARHREADRRLLSAMRMLATLQGRRLTELRASASTVPFTVSDSPQGERVPDAPERSPEPPRPQRE